MPGCLEDEGEDGTKVSIKNFPTIFFNVYHNTVAVAPRYSGRPNPKNLSGTVGGLCQQGGVLVLRDLQPSEVYAGQRSIRVIKRARV